MSNTTSNIHPIFQGIIDNMLKPWSDYYMTRTEWFKEKAEDLRSEHENPYTKCAFCNLSYLDEDMFWADDQRACEFCYEDWRAKNGIAI